MNAKLIHSLIKSEDLNKFNDTNLKELYETLKDRIIYSLNDFEEYPLYPKIIYDLFKDYKNKGYNFNICHYIKTLINYIEFNNTQDYLKHDFIVNHYNLFDDDLLNQYHYRLNCQRILNNELSNDITTTEYLSYLLYDDYYYHELLNDVINNDY
jgi:hypothetical protein